MQATDGSRHKQSGRQGETEQQLEQLLQSGIPVQQAAQAGQNQIALQQEVKSEQDPVEQLNEKFPPAKVEELIELVNHWRDVKRNLSPQMKYCLQRATLSVNERGKWIFLRGTRAY